MFLIQELRGGGTPESINEKYAINAKRHRKFPNLVLFKYNQIESPMGDPVVQEARGIILDEANNWEIVARPFDKFFNHLEGHAAAVDWSTARFYEKLDGSLATMYYYRGEWHVATSGTPDASGEVNDYGFTFEELFWRVFYTCGYQLPTDRNMTYMFELMTPYNRIVVRHDFNRLVLIGARDLTSGEEVSVESVTGFQVVKSFPLGGINDAVESFSKIDPMNQEGYVVADAKFNRVKVKHPGYVALHHLKSGLSLRRLLEVVLAGEVAEVTAHFPEYAEHIETIKGKLESMRLQIDADFAACGVGTDRKAFAMKATKTKHPDALFALFAKKVPDAGAYIKGMRPEALYTRLELKEINVQTDQS